MSSWQAWREYINEEHPAQIISDCLLILCLAGLAIGIAALVAVQCWREAVG